MIFHDRSEFCSVVCGASLLIRHNIRINPTVKLIRNRVEGDQKLFLKARLIGHSSDNTW